MELRRRRKEAALAAGHGGGCSPWRAGPCALDAASQPRGGCGCAEVRRGEAEARRRRRWGELPGVPLRSSPTFWKEGPRRSGGSYAGHSLIPQAGLRISEGGESLGLPPLAPSFLEMKVGAAPALGRLEKRWLPSGGGWRLAGTSALI